MDDVRVLSSHCRRRCYWYNRHSVSPSICAGGKVRSSMVDACPSASHPVRHSRAGRSVGDNHVPHSAGIPFTSGSELRPQPYLGQVEDLNMETKPLAVTSRGCRGCAPAPACTPPPPRLSPEYKLHEHAVVPLYPQMTPLLHTIY